MLSLSLHAVLVGIVAVLTSRTFEPVGLRPPDAIRITVPLTVRSLPAVAARLGGSNQTALPARKGEPPPKGLRTFIPPRMSTDPKLPLAVTVAFDSPTIQIAPATFGDPASLLNGGLGNNGGIGIGNGPPETGVGNDGAGPSGLASNPLGSRIRPPVLIYKEDPEFSELARKARYQGTVLLAIEVDALGHPRNIRVLRSLGFGLDEKAIEAVTRWVFRPGLQNGRPVVTTAMVEVNFRLL